MPVTKCRPALLLLVLGAVAGLGADCGRERLLPRPEPLAVHQDAGLGAWEQRKLDDIRRFLPPAEQLVLEQTLVNLETDSRLPRDEVRAALKRALSGIGAAAGFCGRLRDELRSLRLSGGPVVEPPARVGTAVSIAFAHEHWLSDAGRRRYPEPLDLARAIRDGELPVEARAGGKDGVFALDAPLIDADAPLFVSDAADLARRDMTPAQGLCLVGPPAPSYVVVTLESAELGSPLRIPTAADAVCRAKFVLPPAVATQGATCAGLPEFVTSSETVAKVRELRLSR
jgi:hypothetical protein